MPDRLSAFSQWNKSVALLAAATFSVGIFFGVQLSLFNNLIVLAWLLAIVALLNFLQGCRKQMFITFAIFALVKVHGMPVETTMILVLINQTLLTLTGPMLGRMVDRFGERLMLILSYCGWIFVFLGYALVEDLGTLYVLYCVDNLIFFGSIALTT